MKRIFALMTGVLLAALLTSCLDLEPDKMCVESLGGGIEWCRQMPESECEGYVVEECPVRFKY